MTSSRKPKKKKANRITYQDILIRLRRIEQFQKQYENGEKKLTSEDLLRYKRGLHGKFTYEWPELLFLRSQVEELSLFLLALDVKTRRIVIMREEMIGFSQNSLRTLYGFNNDKMRYFTRVDSIGKNEQKMNNQKGYVSRNELVRKIFPDINIPIEFFAFIALLARVPLQWLTRDKPDLSWSVEHFGLLETDEISGKDLIPFINSLKPDVHDIRAVVINEHELERLYLRVEILFGTVIVELSNTYATTTACRRFRALFYGKEILHGYKRTVIPSQINQTIIWRHCESLRPICPPVEFEKFDRSLY
ncbi:hypothetical protein EJP82_25135 [Paenibacillus anaericanus]|uniref:Uncharacterized protein n=1 Tax=Paenibacillus anaericanus TaxID=170367 RepID=A0A3S1BGI0_9BACL|nr:hypothetical protein [Paenibacillus anaericanus]RUT40371.1 hypothetical protein EJP82_25135 [Paenibacillus anaericanus]